MSEYTLVLTYPPASRTELKLVKSVNPVDWQKSWPITNLAR